MDIVRGNSVPYVHCGSQCFGPESLSNALVKKHSSACDSCARPSHLQRSAGHCQLIVNTLFCQVSSELVR